MTTTRAILFDLDDTLYEEAQFVRGGFQAVGEELQRRGIFRREYTGHTLRVLEGHSNWVNHVAVTPDAAAYLVERKPMTIGIDGPSVGPFHEGIVETHQHLLGAGIWVIEGLDLSRVSAGSYDLVCLPLKVVGADGAPARVVLRPRGTRR